MASEEIKFLRDQVLRLNATLSEYQEKYPPVGLRNGILDKDIVDKPWLTDRSLMSPLLAEYDSTNITLKEQAETYKNELRELRTQVDKLVAENRRLTKDLKLTIQSQLTDLGPDVEPNAISDDKVIQNLQHQLSMALKEKDSAMEMWQAAVGEVERLERNLKDKQFNPRLQALEGHANQIKDQYAKTVSELNCEIHTLQEELTIAKNEAKIAELTSTDLRATVDTLKTDIARQDRDKALVAEQKDKAESRALQVESRVLDLESKLGVANQKLSKILEEKRITEQKILDLQKLNAEAEQKDYETSLQLRESVQLVENALLEKDQALLREKQKEEEVQRLELTISKLFEEAGLRTRQEVDNVKRQCNENIAKLMEEIQSLEMVVSEKQAQVDRAIREKKSIESELDKIYQEGLVHGSKTSSEAEDLTRRACNAERSRDEARVKVDSLQQQLTRAERSYKQEKSHLESEMEQIRDRLNMMNQEFERVNDDRVQLIQDMDVIKRKMQQAQQDKEATQRQMLKEKTCLEHDAQMKERDYQVKLQTLEDTQRHAMTELRQLLTAQQRMSAKWKEECQAVAHKYEENVRELRSEVTRHKQRNEELNKLLKESRDKTADVEHMLTEYTGNIKRMEERVRQAEDRAATVATQSLKRNKNSSNIIEERKYLQRQLERSLKESQGIMNRTNVAPLAVSDLAQSGRLKTTPMADSSGISDR